MAGEVGAIDAVGGANGAQAQTNAFSPQDQADIDSGMDALILNFVFFSFSMMQSEIANGMRQQSQFLSEVQAQDGND
jgi:hypothetical protein